ncbi:hypothetical protein EYC80_006197 [Monilinia laxa]|uniref:PSI domain-containing protein n=1 Tax=Monilinia laxa TaxID=61186 RepID=A0A5N6KGG2_MONLA|nr:hypothetical protein EYC80_006197 [Monilinia laxa]
METMIRNASSEGLLNKCWGHQECWGCLATGPCSWCSVSSTCVPNTSPVHILAPIFNSDICPLWSERWELRTRPLGCHVSTITFLTFFGSIYGTLVAIGLVVLIIRFMRNEERRQEWWKILGRYPRKWWGVRKSGVIEEHESPESRPLLGQV